MKLLSHLIVSTFVICLFPTVSEAAYQSSDPVLLSYYRLDEYYNRDSTKRGVHEYRLRRQRENQMPQVTVPKTIRDHMREKEQAERKLEKCVIYRDVVGRLRDSVLGAIPEASVYFVLSTTIEGIFDKVLSDCPYEHGSSAGSSATESTSTVGNGIVDNKCHLYGERTRRRRVCEYNQSRNMPFLGGQYRR